MAVVTRSKWWIELPSGRKWFEVVINVNVEGEFTALLPEDITQELKRAGIECRRSTRSPGKAYICASSLNELKSIIGNYVKDYESLQLIEEKIVILYEFQTKCAFCYDGEDIVPNGEYVKNRDPKWIKGTVDIDTGSFSNNIFSIGIKVYPRLKKRYVRRNGVPYTEYVSLNSQDIHKGTFLHWLYSCRGMYIDGSRAGSGGIQEMDYTEERALFFVNVIKGICSLSEKLKGLNSPEFLENLIEENKGVKLI